MNKTKKSGLFTVLLLLLQHLSLASSTISTPRDNHHLQSTNTEELFADGENSRTKKKNIPLVPKPNDGVPGLTSLPLRYSGGKHPVLREFISDHPSGSSHPSKEELVGTKKDIVVQPPATNYVSDPYASFVPPNQEGVGMNNAPSHRASKRFELYPKWFSNKVPSIFGKRFSKTYYYPFDGNVVKSRDTIARSPSHHFTAGASLSTSRRRVHSLPMSYMQGAMPAPIHINAMNGATSVLGRHRRKQRVGGPVSMLPIDLYGGAGDGVNGAAGLNAMISPIAPSSSYGGDAFVGGSPQMTSSRFGGINSFRGGEGMGHIGVMDIPDESYQPQSPFMGGGNNGFPGYPMTRVPNGLMQQMEPEVYQPPMSSEYIKNTHLKMNSWLLEASQISDCYFFFHRRT